MAKNDSLARKRHLVTKKHLSLTEVTKKDNASPVNILKEAAEKLKYENSRLSDNLPENTKSNKQKLNKHYSLHKKQHEDDDIAAKSMPSSPRNESHKKDHVGLYTVYKLKQKQHNIKPSFEKECQSAPVSPTSSVRIKYKNPNDGVETKKKLYKKSEEKNLKSEISALEAELEMVKSKLEEAKITHKNEIGMLYLTVRDLDKARIENKLIIDNLVKISDGLIYSQKLLSNIISNQKGELTEKQKKSLEQAIQSLELTEIIRNQIFPFYADKQKVNSNQTGILHTENSENSDYGHQIHGVTTDYNYEKVDSIGENPQII